ncbi:hypothetical protein K505DRAFT_116898 [Melanomma pulvis-pyrius CBS 109.77]|uniref:Uncharacterized protein n=1 Tax=Melanomma pulvis-pyrius CBS 109.77 TaxID=1314802 RepID=A0A6A6WVZ2_9PLEO|nr:hypothetical protein K505DRAFT_116898 [Melanomma pulvis-pyrius CBS 109.77]
MAAAQVDSAAPSRACGWLTHLGGLGSSCGCYLLILRAWRPMQQERNGAVGGNLNQRGRLGVMQVRGHGRRQSRRQSVRQGVRSEVERGKKAGTPCSRIAKLWGNSSRPFRPRFSPACLCVHGSRQQRTTHGRILSMQRRPTLGSHYNTSARVECPPARRNLSFLVPVRRRGLRFPSADPAVARADGFGSRDAACSSEGTFHVTKRRVSVLRREHFASSLWASRANCHGRWRGGREGGEGGEGDEGEEGSGTRTNDPSDALQTLATLAVGRQKQ